MKLEIKDYVRALIPHHIEKSIPEIQDELGTTVVQMGSNINPSGPSPFALKTIFDNMGELHHYPNSTAQPLREGISRKYDVPLASVMTGNGVPEIAQMVINVHCNPGDEIVLSHPTSLAFQRVAKGAGLDVKNVPLKEDHCYDLDAMLGAISDKCKTVYITNPNNPMGTGLKHAEIKSFLEKLDESVLLIVDESAIEYATDPEVSSVCDLVGEFSNLLILRTFSQVYGLAGLCCAFAIGPDELIEYSRRLNPSYCVNFLAQVGCVAALTDDEYVERTVETNKVNREIMEAGLKKLERYQVSFIPSQSNFITVFLPILGDHFTDELLKAGFRVRSLSYYGIDNGVRISLGTRPDTIRCVYAMARVLKDLLGGDQ